MSPGRMPAFSMDSPRTRRAKILAGPAAGVKGQIVLDALLRQDGAAGGHVAHHRHLVLLLDGLPQGDGPALAGALFDDPASSSRLRWKWTVEGDLRPTASPISRTEGGYPWSRIQAAMYS